MHKFSITEKIAMTWFGFWIITTTLAFIIGPMGAGENLSGVDVYWSALGCWNGAHDKGMGPMFPVYAVITFLLLPMISDQGPE